MFGVSTSAKGGCGGEFRVVVTKGSVGVGGGGGLIKGIKMYVSIDGGRIFYIISVVSSS